MPLDLMGEKIARCRLVFSVFVVGAVLIDPMQPVLNPWVRLLSGDVPLDPDLLGATGFHLLYSTLLYAALQVFPARRSGIAVFGTWADVLFATAIAFVTEGKSSLFYPFFTFAIVEAGLQGGLRRTMKVTTTSVLLWLGLVLFYAPTSLQLSVMRPVYLLVVGYLVGYLGEQRLALESELRHLDVTQQRARIARDLHDGYLQVLAAVNLQVETCRQLLQAGHQDQVARVEGELAELQRAVNGEHDELRAYVRSLAGVEPARRAGGVARDPRFALRVDVAGSGVVLEHVLQILREGITNVRRHADAASAAIRVEGTGAALTITMDDDGRGFRNAEQRPWSIASRVRELGGVLTVTRDARPGAHLEIVLPGA